MDWEDIRFFLALARYGSLSAAARALGVNHATVARRVAGLEAAVGAVLFDRRPSGYTLTGAGGQALAQAGAMAEAAEGLGRLGSGSASGLVRLTATRSLGEGFLLPHLAVFQCRYPAIDVELLSDSRSMSLARFEADLALRFARPVDGDVKARQVAVVPFALYGTEDWRVRLAGGEAPRFIGFDEASAQVPEALWLTRTFPQARLVFRVNNHLAQREAALRNMGIAVLPSFLACPGLCRLDLGAEPAPRDLWLLWRMDAGTRSPVRLLVDFLTETLKQPDLLS